SRSSRRLRRFGLELRLVSPLFRRPRFYVPAVLLLCALAAAGIYLSRRQAATPEIAFSDFLQQVDRGQVEQIRFADGAITVKRQDATAARTVPPPNFLVSDGFLAGLTQHGVRIEAQPSAEPGSLNGSAVALAGVFLALLGFTVYRTTAGRIHTPGKANLADRDGQVVTFQDLAGVDEAKGEGR